MNRWLAAEIIEATDDAAHAAYCTAMGTPSYPMSDEDGQELLRMLKSVLLFVNTQGEPDHDPSSLCPAGAADRPAGDRGARLCDGEAASHPAGRRRGDGQR